MKTFFEIIGEDAEKLTALQMGIRAALVFIVALILIRLSGRRAFGQRSPFDNVIAILLGAILSRSVAHSEVHFFAPIVASIVIVVFHRLISLISTYSDTFGRIVKGDEKILFQNGMHNKKNMNRANISEKDLREGIRKEGNVADESQIKEAWLERDGSISVIKKE